MPDGERGDPLNSAHRRLFDIPERFEARVASVLEMSGGGPRAAAGGQRKRRTRAPVAKPASTQRSRVAELQRARLLRAAVEVAAEHGYTGISATAIVAAAKVSSRTFYEFFDSAEACLVAACEQCLGELVQAAAPAYGSRGTWAERLRAALTAALEFLDSQPRAGKLAVAFLLGAGAEPQRRRAGRDPRARRARTLALVTAVLEDARAAAPPALAPCPLTAEVLVTGTLGAIHSRLARADGPLLELVNPLMSLLVLPFLGAEAAAAQLNHSPRRVRASRSLTPSDPVRELGIRLTYRTAQVIDVIADGDGLSNAEIASAAGIRDQGQISKLLHRLAHHGVILNTQTGRATGLANAWSLTATGVEVHRAIAHRALPGH